MKIEIYGQAYNVHADGNEEQLKELAAFVDAKMRMVAEATHTVDSVRVAVLAALNIADELHTMQGRWKRSKGRCSSASRNAWRWWKRPSNSLLSCMARCDTE